MFDVTRFLDRKKWTIADLASRLFDKGGSSRVGMWKTGDSNPRYAEIIKLIELGATAEELFGKEAAETLNKNSSELNRVAENSDIFNTPEFQDGMKKAIEDMMKLKGLIK